MQNYYQHYSMHINHLIWDRIFTDPEFGGLEPFRTDPFGCIDIAKHKIDNRIVADDDAIIKKLYKWTGGSRGIHVKVPSLKAISILTLVEKWDRQLDTATHIMEQEMNVRLKDINIVNNVQRTYETMLHLQNISRDALDITIHYNIDVNRINNKSTFYYNQFKEIYAKFKDIYRMLTKVIYEYGLDILEWMTVHIEQIWSIIIDIFKMHHELVCDTPKNLIIPRYYTIYGMLRERIHLYSRYKLNR